MASPFRDRPQLPGDVLPPASPPASPPRPRRASWSRWGSPRSLGLIAALLVIGALKFAQGAVVPVLFAVFIALLLSPVVEWLARGKIPRVLAATCVVAALLTLVTAGLSVTWTPARAWLDTAPATFQKLERKLRPVTRFIAKVESVSDQAERMTAPVGGDQGEPTPVSLEPKGFVESTQEWVIMLVSMLFLTLFLLATDLDALARRHPPGTPLGDAAAVVTRVRSELGRYFGAVTLSNLCLGIGTAVAMYLLDMPNAILWGAIAFTFNFVPYAGSAVTLVLLTIVALVSFEGVGQALYVAGTYLLLTTLEGQVLQPVLVGRRLDVSPPLVLLGLWFGGWMWGVAGIALAMPLLVSVKAARQEVLRARKGETEQAYAETVRSRASDWWRDNARRYGRAARAPQPKRPGRP